MKASTSVALPFKESFFLSLFLSFDIMFTEMPTIQPNVVRDFQNLFLFLFVLIKWHLDRFNDFSFESLEILVSERKKDNQTNYSHLLSLSQQNNCDERKKPSKITSWTEWMRNVERKKQLIINLNISLNGPWRFRRDILLHRIASGKIVHSIESTISNRQITAFLLLFDSWLPLFSSAQLNCDWRRTLARIQLLHNHSNWVSFGVDAMFLFCDLKTSRKIVAQTLHDKRATTTVTANGLNWKLCRTIFFHSFCCTCLNASE